MKKILITICILLLAIGGGLYAHSVKPVDSMNEIKNFHFVSENLASSGMLTLEDYQYIKDYGFKHVINLLPGMQIKEKRRVESLGLSYQQISVDFSEPTLENFKEFSKLMQTYGEEKVFVHCQLNWRASAFVYLYRVTQMGISEEQAGKDLAVIWEPHHVWETFVKDTVKYYQQPELSIN